jgi:chromosomal replication initiator protein
MVVDMVDEQAIDTWKAVLGDLQLQVSKPIYETWLKDTVGLSIADNIITVGVPTPFAMEWLERRMYQPIQETVQKVTTESLEVRFQVGESFHNNGPQNGSNGHPAAPTPNDPQPQGRTMELQAPVLNAKYSFKSFVVGPSNRLGYSAAKAVADAPGQTYNPLFLYSGVGLGKTHLLHAIGHDCAEKGMSFAYVTSEKFTNEFIAAIGNRTTEEFRNKYRSVDVLLIDDIQFISGKEQTQEGFFHTFNDLHNSNRQVVLTSDRPPKAMALLEDRLRSRFEWGLIADIQPPDLETRMAILLAKARQLGVALGESIIEFVAKKVQKNVRELEGSLNRIVALSRLTEGPITLDMASQAVADFMPDMSRDSVDPDRIMEEVTRRFKVSNSDLVGTSRKKPIVRARHVAMYLLHEELGMKDTEIGRLLGGRDHSTIINAVGKVNYEINVDAHLRQDVLSIKEAIFN